jgi:hypothetical protein
MSELSKIARVQGVLARLPDDQLDAIAALLHDDGPDTRRIVARAIRGLRALRKAA